MNNLLSFILRMLGPDAWITIIRYLLVAGAGVLIARGWLDEGSANLIVEKIIGIILLIIPTLSGAAATVTPKVVTEEGKTVKTDKMAPADKAKVETAAANTLTKS